MAVNETKIYRVAELNRLVRNALEAALPDEVSVVGEISNLRIPASGHGYFTLKDEAAQMAAIIWRGDLARQAVVPQDGMQVQITGRLTVYERGGNYQIVVRIIQPAGVGALHAAFQRLKRKLEEEGLFAATRKRTLPMLPRHLGIVTSPTGAALRDIINILDRRFPAMRITIAPARVQGQGAADEIAAAIDLLNRATDVDVIIVGRGGGSLEDLWAFNEEAVARAIVRSAAPVISAVGHETDYTISDFAADVRAPTPSAAAEIVVERKDLLENMLELAGRRLGRSLREATVRAGDRLRALQSNYVLREPRHAVAIFQGRLAALGARAARAAGDAWREAQQANDAAQQRMRHALQLARERADGQYRHFAMQLRALNPFAVLERGYSVTRRTDGAIVRRAADVRPGMEVTTRLAKGSFTAEVKVVDEKNQ